MLTLQEIFHLFTIEECSFSEIEKVEEDEYFLVIDAMSYSTPDHQSFVLMKWLGQCDEEKNKRLCVAEQEHFNHYCRRFLQYTEETLYHKNYGMFNLYENNAFFNNMCMLAVEGKEIKMEKIPPRSFDTLQAQWQDFRIIGVPPFIYFGRFFNWLTAPIFEFFLFYFPVKRAFLGDLFLESYMKIPCVLRKYEKIAQGLPLFLN